MRATSLAVVCVFMCLGLTWANMYPSYEAGYQGFEYSDGWSNGMQKKGFIKTLPPKIIPVPVYEKNNDLFNLLAALILAPFLRRRTTSTDTTPATTPPIVVNPTVPSGK